MIIKMHLTLTAAGRSFGELALINTDCVRNASIIADEPTDLIIVNRDLYNRSLKVGLHIKPVSLYIR